MRITAFCFLLLRFLQVIEAAKGAEAALSGFHVEHRDDIVVQFGPET